MFIYNQYKQHIRVIVYNCKTKTSELWCGNNSIKFLFPKVKDKKNNLKRLCSEGRVRVLIPSEGKDNLQVTDQNSFNVSYDINEP